MTLLRKLFLLLFLSCIFGSGAFAAGPKVHIVIIENMTYAPDVLTVKSGDVIEFLNKDLVPHTVTGSSGEKFDSGILESGAKWRFETSSRGTFSYYCRIHTDMKGRIKVTL